MRSGHVPQHGPLLRQLRQTGPVLKGSLVDVQLTCGTPSCRCHQKGPKHTGLYFSYRYGGRSRTVYVPKAAEPAARQAHAQWQRLKRILEELTALEVDRLRSYKRRCPRSGKEKCR